MPKLRRRKIGAVLLQMTPAAPPETKPGVLGRRCAGAAQGARWLPVRAVGRCRWNLNRRVGEPATGAGGELTTAR